MSYCRYISLVLLMWFKGFEIDLKVLPLLILYYGLNRLQICLKSYRQALDYMPFGVLM